MDEQQHLQGRPPNVNPYRRGDRVRLNVRARGKWAKRADLAGYVAEEPGAYMVAVRWVRDGERDVDVHELVTGGEPVIAGSEAFHFGWLEPAPIGEGEDQMCS